VSANLSNGVLVVSAPKDLTRIEESIRKIEITTMEDMRPSEPIMEDTAAELPADAEDEEPDLSSGEADITNEASTEEGIEEEAAPTEESAD